MPNSGPTWMRLKNQVHWKARNQRRNNTATRIISEWPVGNADLSFSHSLNYTHAWVNDKGTYLSPLPLILPSPLLSSQQQCQLHVGYPRACMAQTSLNYWWLEGRYSCDSMTNHFLVKPQESRLLRCIHCFIKSLLGHAGQADNFILPASYMDNTYQLTGK